MMRDGYFSTSGGMSPDFVASGRRAIERESEISQASNNLAVSEAG
jgi:hypothetical protein